MTVTLPIDEHIGTIVEALAGHGAAVVVAPPGSGKTTRVPPALLAAACARDGRVVVLEPRRIAARAAARRIAAEQGWRLGGEVGYHVRFDRVAGPDTRLLLVTEGILTRRLQRDPALEDVAVVVLDEFHERSLHADLALALLREVRSDLRPDLKVMVMSATIEPGPVAEFLGGAPVVEVAGRPHAVEVRYLPRQSDGTLVETVVAGVRAAVAEADGDVLVFLPGVGEIVRCQAQLSEHFERAGMNVLPLHGDLPPDQQDRVLEPADSRKIILATNVAETSLTIEGVDTVVDCGFVRQLQHDPRLGLDRLELRRISVASAEQRAGRAGRTGPGTAWRLWTASEQRGLDPFDAPEVRRVDLAATVLELRAWGVRDPATFGWYEAPAADDIRRAEQLLGRLGALDVRTGRLTELGSMMLGLPVHPRLGRLLIEAWRRGRLADGAVLAALLSERDILYAARMRNRTIKEGDLHSAPSDVLWRLELFRAAERAGFRNTATTDLGLEPRALQQVRRTARELQRSARTRLRDAAQHTTAEGDDGLLKAVLAAFPDRVVKRRGADERSGLMVGGRGVTLAPDSVVRHAALLVAVNVDQGGRGRATSWVRWASAVQPAWLEELFPEAVERASCVTFDEAGQRVTAIERVLYHDLPLEEKPGRHLDPAAAARELAAAARRWPEQVLPVEASFHEWLARLQCLREWRPELGLPALDRQALLDVLADLCVGRRSFKELRRIDLVSVILGRLTYEQRQALEREAPERLQLPGGRRARIRYEQGKAPLLSARVQDLFGLTDTPRVGGGRTACVVEILAPNQRPIQVTQDLPSFWATTYPRVRKDLRGRYPKHDWPEKPAG